MIDEIYDKYEYIIYKWCETKPINQGVRIYGPRNEYYGDEQFYVFGIGVSNFLEPNDYEKSGLKSFTDKVVKDASQDEQPYDPVKILKTICGSNRITLDDLHELSTLLKEAGAKEVYLHPSFWVDHKSLVEHPITNEWLIVIPKEN